MVKLYFMIEYAIIKKEFIMIKLPCHMEAAIIFYFWLFWGGGLFIKSRKDMTHFKQSKPSHLFKISSYHFVLKMICLLFFCTIFFCSCGDSSNLNAKNSPASTIVGATSFPIQNLPKVSATNQVIQENNAALDIGNISQGYFLASYSGG